MQWESQKEKDEGEERVFEGIMVETSPNLMKDVKIHIQEAKLSPRKINSKRSTLRHIIVKLSTDKDQENLEKSKRKMTCHVQGLLNKINSQMTSHQKL